MAQAKKMLSKLKRMAEGGEVTDEFPEEAGVMPGQNPSEAAKRLLYYKKTAAPPMAPSTDQPDGMYQEPTVASETARVFGMKPREDRGSILPIYKSSTGLVAPDWMYDIARNATAADMARRGYAVAPEEAVNMALNVAGGGLGVSTAMRNPTGKGGKDLGMFVGQKSETWDMDKYTTALDFEKAGIDPAEINRLTGYWKNPSSKVWSQEISDHTANLIPGGLPNTLKDSAPITNVLSHTPLFKAYPDLKNVIVKRESGVGAEGAKFDPAINTLFIGEKVTDPKTQLSYMLHELQHWVQTKENFPRGSSPEEIAKIETPEMAKINARLGQLFYAEKRDPKNQKEFTELMAKLKDLKKIQKDNSFELYNRVEGEAQARATQERMWMDDPTRRELTPLGNFDVPVTELVQMGQFGELAPTSRVPPPMRMTLPSGTTAKEDLAKMPKAPKGSKAPKVLPKAERDANLEKFMEGSVVPPVYHATTQDFSKFMLSKAGKNTKHPTSKLGIFTATNPDSTNDFITARFNKNRYETGANVMPVHMNIKNPFEISSSDFVFQSMALQQMKKKDADKYIQDFVQSVKDEGHDGLLIKSNPRGFAGGSEFTSDNYVAFEPTQIKSAIGNKGTYDPTNPDITKAKGGEVRKPK